jgi:hypothetical protein
MYTTKLMFEDFERVYLALDSFQWRNFTRPEILLGLFPTDREFIKYFACKVRDLFITKTRSVTGDDWSIRHSCNGQYFNPQFTWDFKPFELWLAVADFFI